MRAWSSVVTRKNPPDLSIHRASVMLDHVQSCINLSWWSTQMSHERGKNLWEAKRHRQYNKILRWGPHLVFFFLESYTPQRFLIPALTGRRLEGLHYLFWQIFCLCWEGWDRVKEENCHMGGGRREGRKGREGAWLGLRWRILSVSIEVAITPWEPSRWETDNDWSGSTHTHHCLPDTGLCAAMDTCFSIIGKGWFHIQIDIKIQQKYLHLLHDSSNILLPYVYTYI